MGSRETIFHEGIASTLKSIVDEKYKILVVFERIPKNLDERVRGGYRIFPEFNEDKIKDYAKKLEKDKTIDIKKIEIYQIDCNLVKEIEL